MTEKASQPAADTKAADAKVAEAKAPERALLAGTPLCPRCGEQLVLPSPSAPSQAAQLVPIRCLTCSWTGVARRAIEDRG